MNYEHTHIIKTGINNKPELSIGTCMVVSPQDLADLLNIINEQIVEIKRLKGDCKNYQLMMCNGTDKFDNIKKDMRAWMQNAKGFRLNGLKEAMRIIENYCT